MVDKSAGDDGCWPWIGCKNRDGYGVFRFYKRSRTHRFSWMIHNDMKDPGKSFVCHSCDNPTCVNPAHLWLGTHEDNMKDMVRKKRGVARYWPRPLATHCKQGHEWKPETTRLHKGVPGTRECAICYRATWMRCEARTKAKRLTATPTAKDGQ